MAKKFHKIDSTYVAIASETLQKQIDRELAQEDRATAILSLLETEDDKRRDNSGCNKES